mmetsp:Transcript_9254/g.29184  ORF Transcript_9254/g.29184 Transcript_9254/m.29184 type:complete len:344 (-) Transcript_9254:91-1122(-)
MSGSTPSSGSVPFPSARTKRASAAARIQKLRARIVDGSGTKVGDCPGSGGSVGFCALSRASASAITARALGGMLGAESAVFTAALASSTLSASAAPPSPNQRSASAPSAALMACFSLYEEGSAPPCAALYSATACSSSTTYGTCLRSELLRVSTWPNRSRANASSSGNGSTTRRSDGVLSLCASTRTCSIGATRTVPTRPYERRTTSGRLRSRHADASSRSDGSVSCVAITSEKSSRNAGLVRIRLPTSSCTYDPRTCSFSSLSRRVTHSARGLPRSASSRKKLFPRSRAVTSAPSITVNEPMPGRTRFFSASVPVALPLSKHSLHRSSASCPCSPHMRSCRS